jgi:phospholipase C
MFSRPVKRRGRRCAAVVSAVVLAGAAAAMPARIADADGATDQFPTATPIKHVIVVIGENRTFDHIYGTYVPKSGDSILNLLSEGIVGADGAPGPNFSAAKQFTTSGQTSYFIGVDNSSKTLYTTLPAPTLGGAPNMPSTTMPPFTVSPTLSWRRSSLP